MRKIKILVSISQINSGGVAKAAVDLVNALDKEKYEVTLISMLDGVFADRLDKAVIYCAVFNRYNIRLFYLMMDRRLPKWLLAKFLIRSRYDIEIAFATVMAPVISASPNKKSKKIVYQHVAGGDMPRAYYKS